MKRRRQPRKEEPSHKINRQIRANTVRVVGEGIEAGIYGIREALNMASDMEVDLVEISPKADPPVCRLVEYSKFKYEQKKRQKELKAKAHKTVVKEIRFGPNTDQHDLDFKTKHAVNFLKEGNKVKAYVQFHGRSIIYKDRGRDLLAKFIDNVEEFGRLEQAPKMEGRRMSILLGPIK